MKRDVYKVATALLAMILSYSAHTQTIKLMTYNIRLDVASDAENAWPNRRDYLISQVKFFEPDILGTQEGLPHQIAYMQEQLNDYSSNGMGREGEGQGESTHIFFKKSKFTLLESHTFWLSETPEVKSMGWDAACLRVCTALLLKEKGKGTRFWVFNTHLDHMGELARNNSMDLILKKMSAFNPKNLPLVFMGDFNSLPGSAAVEKVKSTMVNCHEASVSGHFGPEGTFNGFKFNEPVTKLIDYIFVSKSNKIKILKHAFLSDNKNLRYPSDHFPVFAEIILRK